MDSLEEALYNYVYVNTTEKQNEATYRMINHLFNSDRIRIETHFNKINVN